MSELLARGLDLAVYGMGTVFVFLTLLVFLTVLMSKLVGTPEAPAGSVAEGIEPGVLAAIGAAVRQYRAARHP